jgi:prepilin-type N-terminal cleavage/methylation domain-containing protein
MIARPVVRRGMTLIELMIGMSIFLVAVAASGAIMITGSTMAWVTERRGNAQDSARLGMDAIVHAVQNSGLGTPLGLYVLVGGASRLVSPVYGNDNFSGGTDDLWVAVADNNSFRNCEDTAGGGTVILSPGTGPLGVRCVKGFNNGDYLVATNFRTGALLTGVTLTASPSATINYAESATAGFSDAPGRGDFQTQDNVFRVRLLHFFIRQNPVTRRNALYMARGTLASDLSAGPFADPANGEAEVVANNIEDLQIAYGLFDALQNDYSFKNGYSWSQLNQVSSLRVSVVATSPLPQMDSKGNFLEYHPMKVENNDPGTVIDGYERVVYSRRIELPNLLPTNL